MGVAKEQDGFSNTTSSMKSKITKHRRQNNMNENVYKQQTTEQT